jgi:hypothetical protein
MAQPPGQTATEPLEIIRGLSATPRLGGSEDSHGARDLIVARLEALGLSVRLAAVHVRRLGV